MELSIQNTVMGWKKLNTLQIQGCPWSTRETQRKQLRYVQHKTYGGHIVWDIYHSNGVITVDLECSTSAPKIPVLTDALTVLM